MNNSSSINKLFGGMRIAATGLNAERARINTIARNVANAETTRMPGTNEPYRRQAVHFAPIMERMANGQQMIGGVEVTKIAPDHSTMFEEIHDPSHPDADSRGCVKMPNVNTVEEMAGLITAVRAYEANLSVQENFVRMAERALRLAE